jgi:hypothetical protein
MESRTFIRYAAGLVKVIEETHNTIGTAVELREQREEVQQDIKQLFAALQNPTLPSAFKLRDAALRNGFQVDPKVLNEMSRFE